MPVAPPKNRSTHFLNGAFAANVKFRGYIFHYFKTMLQLKLYINHRHGYQIQRLGLDL
jgi:hypothetical protein